MSAAHREAAEQRRRTGQTILVVDDEELIRSSLRGILSDVGFRVIDTGHPRAVLEIIDRERPSLVLLDIWMPEFDGLELLKEIKAHRPELRVIVLSGHANIQSALAATRLGADDFIEKPFSVSGLLSAIGRLLENGTAPEQAEAGRTSLQYKPERTPLTAGRKTIPQRTVARSVVLGGHGLHSGLKTGVIVHPAPIGFGIVFSLLGEEVSIPATLDNITDSGYNTTLTAQGRSIRTVEHLMSALHAFGITNALIKTQGEVPALDGSALEFCRRLTEAGVEEQTGTVTPIEIRKPVTVGDENQEAEYLRIEPAPRLIIDYTLDYPAPIGLERVHFELSSPDTYLEEIAPARTFGFVSEFRKLSEMGLAGGGRLDNVILVDDARVVNTTLRFPDEFARHKVLDLIGDLYLLGRPILGHVIASKSGHSDNHALLRAISASL
jgi:UDP-3-O-[3-hydroxymyristoyl] N-acetylglucosamine deacetylase